LRIKFVDGLVGYHNFGGFKIKVSDTVRDVPIPNFLPMPILVKLPILIL